MEKLNDKIRNTAKWKVALITLLVIIVLGGVLGEATDSEAPVAEQERVDPEPVEQDEPVEEEPEPEPTFESLGLVDRQQVSEVVSDIETGSVTDYTTDDEDKWIFFAAATWGENATELTDAEIFATGIGVCYMYTELDNVAELNAAGASLGFETDKLHAVVGELTTNDVCPGNADFEWTMVTDDGQVVRR